MFRIMNNNKFIFISTDFTPIPSHLSVFVLVTFEHEMSFITPFHNPIFSFFGMSRWDNLLSEPLPW